MIHNTGLYLESDLFVITDDKKVIMKLRDKEGNRVIYVLNSKQIDALYRFATLAKTLSDIKTQDTEDSYW